MTRPVIKHFWQCYPGRWVGILLFSALCNGGFLSQAETVRVASISFVPKKFALDSNVLRLKGFFRDAAQKGAQIALAPEGALEGYVVNEIIAGDASSERMRAVAVEIDGPVIQGFQDLAKELEMCLAFGFAESIGNEVFNAAVFIDHEGRISGKYHKMQFHEGYHPDWWFNRLGKVSRAFDTPFGRCGFMICNDRWNPSLAAIPCLDGAQFLLIPAYGSTSKAQDEAVMARGLENRVPVIEANVGVRLIVNHKGEVAAVDRALEGVTVASLEIPQSREVRSGDRDAVETDFKTWREAEMGRRFRATMKRLAKKRDD